jgi:PAS domain-containing protein
MRLDEKSIHDLVGAIYDGGADPARWQHALVQLSDATHSVGALLVARDRVDPKQSRYVHGHLDPDLNQLFLSRYAKDCPWTRVADRTPSGIVYAGDAALPARERIKTEFYAEILRPQQILHEGAAILARDASRLVGLPVFRSPKIGHVDSEDLRLLSLVAPHFKRAAQIAWRLGTLAVLNAAKSVALDRLDRGVLLLDASGHVLFANRAAEAIIGLRDGLTVIRDGLRAALPGDTARLQTLIAETMRRSAGGAMRVTRQTIWRWRRAWSLLGMTKILWPSSCRQRLNTTASQRLIIRSPVLENPKCVGGPTDRSTSPSITNVRSGCAGKPFSSSAVRFASSAALVLECEEVRVKTPRRSLKIATTKDFCKEEN